MKILFVHHGYVLGGAPVSLKNTIQALNEEEPGIEVSVLCLNDTMRAYFSEGTRCTCEVMPNPGLILGRVLIGYSSLARLRTCLLLIRDFVFFLPAVYRQYRVFGRHAPTLVHLNSSILISSACAAALRGIPVVWHIRETILRPQGSILRAVITGIIKKTARRIIAISPVEAEKLGKDQGGKIRVVYNFIDFTAFDYRIPRSEEWRKRLGISKDDTVLVSLGGLSFRKGTVELIRIAKKLGEKTHVVFAGPGIESAKEKVGWYARMVMSVEESAKRMGLKKVYSLYYAERVRLEYTNAPNIHFIGPQEDVPLLLSICDALVFGGTTPHFPRPVFEAWAMKKPVIAFDQEGIRTMISEGVDGILINPQQKDDAAQTVRLLLNDTGRQRVYGEKGYTKAMDCFDRKKNIRKVIDVYRAVKMESTKSDTPQKRGAKKRGAHCGT